MANFFTHRLHQSPFLNAVLTLSAQAPSGYNLQPWRFIVVRDAENLKRRQRAAINQPKVAEALNADA